MMLGLSLNLHRRISQKFESLRDKSPSVPIIPAINGLDPCKVPIKSPSSLLQTHIAGDLEPDPASLWEKLRIYNGSEVARRLAQKMGWGVERTMVAAQSLVSHGLASMSGDLISPVKGSQA